MQPYAPLNASKTNFDAICDQRDPRRYFSVLGAGCSYGMNAVVHRLPRSFRHRRLRYAKTEMAAVDAEALAQFDRHYYGSWSHIGAARFVALEVSAPAVRYATSVGLLDAGVIGNFETGAPRPEDRRALHMIPYEAVAAGFAERGLVAETLAGAILAQRRFRDLTKFSSCLATLEKLDLDTAKREVEGCFHAELFVPRPREDVAAAQVPRVPS